MFDFSRLFAVPVGVAYHVVAALATWFAPVPGGMATAAAIIVFTVAVRLALTGRERGPELWTVLAALPRAEALRRVDAAL